MKILITGVFSCGKTTLVQRLHHQLPLVFDGTSCVVRADPARLCRLPMNTAQTIHTSFWLAGSVLMQESELEAAGGDWIICDRGLPDILSHTYDQIRQDDIRLSGLVNLTRCWSSTYTHIFRARPDPDIPVEADALRIPARDYRAAMDDLLTRALLESASTVIELPHDLEQRAAIIIKEIESS